MSLQVIIKPVLTEKTVRLAAVDNTYTFAVSRAASKHQVANGVSELYSVDVIRVRTIVNHADTRRTGRRRSVVSISKSKKALVTIKKGQTIAAFDISDAVKEQ